MQRRTSRDHSPEKVVSAKMDGPLWSDGLTRCSFLSHCACSSPTHKSAESAKRLHKNLKDEWPMVHPKREPPGKLYQTIAPHALVEVGRGAREEQGEDAARPPGSPRPKTGNASRGCVLQHIATNLKAQPLNEFLSRHHHLSS